MPPLPLKLHSSPPLHLDLSAATAATMSSLHHLLAAAILLSAAFLSATADNSDEIIPLFDANGIPLPVPVSPVSTFSLPPPAPSRSESAVKSVCAATPASELCERLAVVYADRTQGLTRIDARAVLDLLLRAAIDSTLGVSDKAGRIAAQPVTEDNDSGCLHQCQAGFATAVNDLKAAQSAIAGGNHVAALAKLGAAVGEFRQCDVVFKQESKAMSPVTDNAAQLVSLINVCQSLVNKAFGLPSAH